MNPLLKDASVAGPNEHEIEIAPPNATFENNGVHPGSRGIWVVQNNPRTSDNGNLRTGLTAKEYRTLQEAYDFFNLALFDGLLPQVLITLQRHPRALGYFSAGRFQSRGDASQHIHEIALNPDGFTGNKDEDILSTLVHEMVHVWQQENGKPGRGRYHNREWAFKMCSIGLMPSSTGKPGGMVTGETVSHYILEGGQFAVACGAFLKGFRLSWESAGIRASRAGGNGSDVEGASRDGSESSEPSGETKQTRTKFTCPNCGLNVWAKPDALVDCHQCSIEARETILMCANYIRRVRKQIPRKGEEEIPDRHSTN